MGRRTPGRQKLEAVAHEQYCRKGQPKAVPRDGAGREGRARSLYIVATGARWSSPGMSARR
jgi:hypothetical protein